MGSRKNVRRTAKRNWGLDPRWEDRTREVRSRSSRELAFNDSASAYDVARDTGGESLIVVLRLSAPRIRERYQGPGQSESAAYRPWAARLLKEIKTLLFQKPGDPTKVPGFFLFITRRSRNPNN